MQQVDIALDKLVVSALNARKDLDAGQEDSGIDELASSIRQQGLLSPPIVRPAADGRYEVLAGQRRLHACQRIGLDPVPCLVRHDLGDMDAATLSLMENVHRADMHFLDKARALKALLDHHQSYVRVAKVSALSVSTVRKYIPLLDLPLVLQERLLAAGGSPGVCTLARLATTFSGDDAVEVYTKISGFNQRIQEEILKRSEGSIANVDVLIGEAQEGAFDAKRCGGVYGCEIIRQILRGKLTLCEFEQHVQDIADEFNLSEMPQRAVKDAADAFWKALAVGWKY